MTQYSNTNYANCEHKHIYEQAEWSVLLQKYLFKKKCCRCAKVISN